MLTYHNFANEEGALAKILLLLLATMSTIQIFVQYTIFRKLHNNLGDRNFLTSNNWHTLSQMKPEKLFAFNFKAL